MHYEKLDAQFRLARAQRSLALQGWWWRTLVGLRNTHLAARGCRDVPREGITVARPCGA